VVAHPIALFPFYPGLNYSK